MKKCLNCNKELVLKDYESKRDYNRRKYCNEKCFHEYRNKKMREKIIGLKFDMMTVIDLITENNEKYIIMECDCKDKTIRKYKYSSFKANPATHCGCNNHNKKHGMCNTKLYKSWTSMKKRCDNPDDLHKKYYKNIKICKEWYDFNNFKNWALSNGYVNGYTIERLDITKGYYPDNCTWIPKEKQNINKRNKSHLIINGIDKSYTEWANEYGIRENTIRMRIKYGMDGEELLKPTKKYGLHNPFKKEGGSH